MNSLGTTDWYWKSYNTIRDGLDWQKTVTTKKDDKNLRKHSFTTDNCYFYGQKAEVIENYIKTYRTIAIEENSNEQVCQRLSNWLRAYMKQWQAKWIALNQITISVLNAKKDIIDLMYFMMTTAPRKDLWSMKMPCSPTETIQIFKEPLAVCFPLQLEPTDYKGMGNGLKKAGYATNPKYPQLLIGLIENTTCRIYDDRAWCKYIYPMK